MKNHRGGNRHPLRRVMCVLGLSFLSAALGGGSTSAADPPPSHPRLLLDAAGVARLKQRVATQDGARHWWRGVRKELDARLPRPIKLPPRGGNWYHWYVCPDDGTPLRLGRRLGNWQWEHQCSLCGKTWSGGGPSNPARDFDGCQIRVVHFGYANAIRDSGLAWQLTGERRYLDFARQVLLAYADRYLEYPLHKNQGGRGVGGGRVASQTLTEACWLIPVTQGADLIWNELNGTDRKTIANRLLLPAVREVILPHKLGIHNIQCWKNSAVGLVGYLLGDENLIWEAIDQPDRGYRVQMAKGVTSAGSWLEAAWGYHFYTLRGTWPLTEAARNAGQDLYGKPIHAMFDAPIRLMSPTGVLPAFNDSRAVSVAAQAPLYELAYARWKDPDYLVLLTGHPRAEMAALFGVAKLPEAASLAPQRSANNPAAGCAILRRGQGATATWLCLDYGPHGGGHGHPDKLSFVLYARGAELAVDPGTARYGTPLQKGWFRTTLAHNTLTVDQTSQRRATGHCRAFGSTAAVDYGIFDSGQAFGQGSLIRGVALLDENTLVLVDLIDIPSSTTLDVAYHQRGAWGRLPAGDPWQPPDRPGYRHLRQATARTTDRQLSLPMANNVAPRATVVLAGGTSTTVITATGIGRSVPDRVPVVLFRRSGSRSLLVWAVSLDGTIQELTARQDGLKVVVRVCQAGGEPTQLFWDLSPDAASLQADSGA